MKKVLGISALIIAICSTALAANLPKEKTAPRLAPGYEKAATMIWKVTNDEAMQKFISVQPHALPKDTKTVEIKITVPNRKSFMDMHIYKPQQGTEEKLPIIYYSHGGGYLFRGALYNSAKYQKLADDLKMAIVTEDYRISSEAAQPAQVEDAYAGLKYIHENAKTYGLDGSKLIIMGDSAGGGLTAALAMYNRDHGKLPVKGQVLIYPMLDYRTGGSEDTYKAVATGEFIWPHETNVFAWDKFRGKKKVADMNSKELSYYSPNFAKNFKNLPPAIIYVGDMDLFVNEDIDYANKLIKNGISTELHVVPGLTHAFDLANPKGDLTKDFWKSIYNATKRFLSR